MTMQCRVLVGRGKELGVLAAALDRMAEGAGGVVFLVGESGVGKSRLAQEAASLASARGFLVLTGRAVQSSAPVPLRPVTEALMGAARTGSILDMPEIAEYRPALAWIVPAGNQPGEREAEISPLILGEALMRLLAALGSSGALLVLEDLHWADPETLAVVQYLADSLARRRVLCVVTVRDSEPSAALDMVRTAYARRAATIVEVPRLTGPEVERIAATCLEQETVPEAVTARLLRDCDGLPFAVEELLAAAVTSGELVSGLAGWQIGRAAW